jgi:hypothetical protein
MAVPWHRLETSCAFSEAVRPVAQLGKFTLLLLGLGLLVLELREGGYLPTEGRIERLSVGSVSVIMAQRPYYETVDTLATCKVGFKPPRDCIVKRYPLVVPGRTPFTFPAFIPGIPNLLYTRNYLNITSVSRQ